MVEENVSGKAVKEHQVEKYTAGHSLGWTVERSGSRLAYLDEDETAHVVGVTGAASRLAAIREQGRRAGW
nr:hypothetical protein OG296_19310 [Streptomyces sp. NBC_01001]